MKRLVLTAGIALVAAALLLGLSFTPLAGMAGLAAAQSNQSVNSNTTSPKNTTGTDNSQMTTFEEEALKKTEDNTTSNVTSTASVNSTGTTTTAEQQPPIPPALDKKTIVVQGTASSPGGKDNPFQIIDLLPPRPDGKVYSGIISFTATKPILVAPLQNYAVGNETLIPQVGDLLVFPGGPNGTMIAPAPIMPNYTTKDELHSDIPLPKIFSATVQFAGSGLSVGRLDGQQFLISYTIHATLDKPDMMNSFDSAISNQTVQADNKVTISMGAAGMNETAFDPNPITIHTGDKVTWINNDLDPHTITSG